MILAAASASATVFPVVTTAFFLPPLDTVTFFSVSTSTAIPVRVMVVVGLADTLARRVSTPRSSKAVATSVAVVHRVVATPSTRSVRGRPKRMTIWAPSVSSVSGAGTTTSCCPVVMSWAASSSATVSAPVRRVCTWPSIDSRTAFSTIAYAKVPPANARAVAPAATTGKIFRTSLQESVNHDDA